MAAKAVGSQNIFESRNDEHDVGRGTLSRDRDPTVRILKAEFAWLLFETFFSGRPVNQHSVQ